MSGPTLDRRRSVLVSLLACGLVACQPRGKWTIRMPWDAPIEQSVADAIVPGMPSADVVRLAGRPVAEGSIVPGLEAGHYAIASQPPAIHDWDNSTWIYSIRGQSYRPEAVSTMRGRALVPIVSTCMLFVEVKHGVVVRVYDGDWDSWSMN